MGLPLTGAVFDTLVEVFQTILLEEGLIDRELDEMSRQVETASTEAVQTRFDQAYAGHHELFKAALLDARDYMGHCLANAWRKSAWDLTFGTVAAALISADRALFGGIGRNILVESILWRNIQIPFRSSARAFSEHMGTGR